MDNNKNLQKDYFSIIWQGKWVIIVAAVIAAAIIISYNFLTPRSHQSSFIITLRGANRMTVSGISSTNRASAFISGVINESFFSELVFSKTKTTKKQESLTSFLMGQQLTSRSDKDSNIVYVYTYGQSAAEAKELADKTIEVVKEQLQTLNTSSSKNITSDINKKVIDPTVKRIDELNSQIEIARSKRTKANSSKTSAKISRLNREFSSLIRKQNRFEDYLSDVTLYEIAEGPRLEIIMEPVVTKISRINILFQGISAAVIGLIFGIFLLLAKDFFKDTNLRKE